uniref:Uncharacterized protein n=1 Tax=Siphoviridae sp. ctq8D8 TaxID=2827944 RepID=A0A8S5SMT5_9CAUD|nr:MAG TPA: hypothetical protein [Siphoviridae sp. ctq8D8]
MTSTTPVPGGSDCPSRNSRLPLKGLPHPLRRIQ